MADSDALLRALVEAARELGRCTATSEALRAEFTELHNFVNEQLSVNYRDIADRVSALETARAERRGRWKTFTAIGAAIAGASGLIGLAIDWLRHPPH
jgi:hypothetical protein